MGGQRDKLLANVIAHPQDVRFDDACKVAKHLGFSKGGTGGHAAYARPGDPIGLNFQKCSNGKIPTYQGKQLAQAIERVRAEQAATALLLNDDDAGHDLLGEE